MNASEPLQRFIKFESQFGGDPHGTLVYTQSGTTQGQRVIFPDERADDFFDLRLQSFQC